MSSDDDLDIDKEEKEVSPHRSERGEGNRLSYVELVQEVIVLKSLEYQDATSCLQMLGKDESGCRYAYLMISATNRNLTEISIILQFVHVLFLDLSGNKLNIDGLQILQKMPYLLYLKVENNVIDNCGLEPFDLLQVLNFSRNRIMKTSEFKQLQLECLDVNFNFIEELDLSHEDFPKLKLLEARGNLLDTVRGINLPNLDSLYLAQNKIQILDLEAMNVLVNLRVLHLRDNLIRRLNYFSDKLVKLKYLNLRRNSIMHLYDIAKLSVLPALQTLIILQNPVGGDSLQEIPGENEEQEPAQDDEELGEGEEPLDKFRVDIIILLPNLKRLNKKPVSAIERTTADLERAQRYVEIMADQRDDSDNFSHEDSDSNENEDELL